MKKKILGLLAISGITMFTLCILIGSNEPAFKLIRAVDNPYSITFNRSNGTTTQGNGKTITSSTSAGGKTVYLVNDSATWSTTGEFNKNYIAYLDTGKYVYFSEDSAGNNHFCFQGVTSISLSLNTSYSREIKVETSIDTENWTSVSHYFSSSTNTYEFATPARYIRLKWDLAYSHYLKEITVNYECSSSFAEVPQSLELSNAKTAYSLNDAFIEPDAKVVYASGVKKSVSGVVYSGYNLSEAGDYTVTATYTEGGINVSTTYNITVDGSVDQLVGTFAHNYFSLVFNSDNTGTHIYDSNTLNFSWTHVGSAITLNYVSGNLSDFGNYRLFGSTTTPNTTASLSGDTLTIKTYNAFGSLNSRTLTRQ